MSLRDWLRGCNTPLSGHLWDRWADMGEVKQWERDPIYDAADVKREVGRYVVQVRTCFRCGLKQGRRYRL